MWAVPVVKYVGCVYVCWNPFNVLQRHSWVPYFDNANAIIFLAPISAFDQVGPWSWMLVVSD